MAAKILCHSLAAWAALWISFMLGLKERPYPGRVDFGVILIIKTQIVLRFRIRILEDISVLLIMAIIKI